MVTGKRFQVNPGDVLVLVDEDDFDGPFNVVIRSDLAFVGGPEITAGSDTGGFKLSATAPELVLTGVRESVYGASRYLLDQGSFAYIDVFAYSV